MKQFACLLLITFVSVSIFSCKHTSAELITYIKSPAGLHSSESSLYISKDGVIYLTWIDTSEDNTSKLCYSTLSDTNSWTPAKTITSGNDWFVNWADFPSLTSFGDSNLVAHYLQKSSPETFSYDVKLITSNDNGNTWNTAIKAHTDTTKTEHGFVSKVEIDNEHFFAAWLDGRQNAYAEKDTTIPHQMSLRGGVFNSQNEMIHDYLIDDRVCDCCQTDTAMTQDGPIVVYRDRSHDEIRDIYYSRLINGAWTDPESLHNDNWKIDGCPVNGPAISALDNHIGVVWFSVADNMPSVKVKFSNNNGLTFGDAITISDIYPLGRLDIELLNKNTALVSWMDRIDGKTVIQLQKVTFDGTLSDIVTITETSESRSSGFPRMIVKEAQAYLSWTKVNPDNTLYIETAIINTDLIQ